MHEARRQYRDAGMMLRRLGAMGPVEIVSRGRQALAKRLERIGVFGNPSVETGAFLTNRNGESPDWVSPGVLAGTEDDDYGAGKALLDRFRETASARFFEGTTAGRTRSFLESRIPGEPGSITSIADQICQKRFDLLGYAKLFFGNPVNWHLDPISGRRAPFVHWSRIDPLDPEKVGDSKVIWELSRHQWFVSLGQAYHLTGDERYGDAFAMSIHEWMQANPPGMGINWTSSLEAAFRSISWCWALFLFRDAKALTPALFAKILGWIGMHASRVERYLSYYFSPNTHLTGEALGLFYVGVVFPELRGANRWRALGARVLVEQIERQVHVDGVYFEQSTCYQRYSAEIYLHFLILAARNGIAVPAVVSERLQRMLDFLLAIRWPNGALPQIGDADGGSLLPLMCRTPDDCRGVFAAAAAFFDRPDYAWAAKGVTPEVLWLLGQEGCENFDALCAAPPASAPSRMFSDGGYAVMRGGWGRDAHQLIFDTGPLGCHVSGGHGHADLLGIQCAVFGEPYLVDTGTYGYTGDARWRDYFRGSFAHCTLTVDGLSQAITAGPFKWHQRPSARLRRWVSNEAFDLADADHDAYRCLPDPVTHRRRVFFAKPRYWMVVDELDGRVEHGIELRFQLAPMEVKLDSHDWALTRTAGGFKCLIAVFATAPLKAELAEGRLDPIQGWISPDYGRREPAPMLTYSAVTRLPLRIVTLLLPMDSPFALPPLVTTSLEQRRIELAFDDVLDTIHIDEQDIVLKRRKP